ncbi:MAG: hypothetical protein IID39_07455 [Planctomycetes bacterium]|nr:hypothetical protein [Planctomycetota bacterium]
MNISSLDAVSGIQQEQIQQQITTAVMAQANQVAKEQGEAVLALIDSVVQEGQEASSAAAAHQLDVTA